MVTVAQQTYSSLPMYAYSWGDPSIDSPEASDEVAHPSVDLANPRFVISVEWTWPEGDWTHFSIVRSTRSPVRRREEGQVMMETKGRVWDQIAYQTTGLPVYRDPQPPPGEWVYYTAFVLDTNRIWNFAGTEFEVSIENYNWALRLPELLPGVAIGDLQRSISPAEQSNTLVSFLQAPGAMMDKVVTMGETAQFYWNPLKVPPQMLPSLMASTGYEYDEVLGTGRLRYALSALMGPRQGTLPSIRNFAEGVTGCDVRAEISNNLMIDTNDSSFESGTLTGTKWQPSANMELDRYDDLPVNNVPTIHPNVEVVWYASLLSAGTYTCGPNYTNTTVGSPLILDQGVPVASWTVARMGVHAFKPSAAAVNLSMGLKLYDHVGKFLRDVTILAVTPITQTWAWYKNSIDGAPTSLGTPGFAYAVPWITVSNPCSVDLIVVDDG